ncbi:unnamed protein product [Urochloa decumbens]|uniref:Strictosidine synthase conserved region domain-containing protein n=1 Tax=Urochloa decumbens TaxID=240449 RepID=A0ABC8WVC8_9POAL
MAAGLGLFFKAVALVLAPVVLAVALYSPQGFSPAPMPPEYSYGPDVTAPRHEARALERSERVGEGRLPGPEDLAYDAAGGWLYTGCADGWVRRVSVPGGDVEDWARTGGRPLGVVLAADGGLVVADADIGLLKVSPEREVALLTDAAEGVKFALTDGVDVAADSTIYFTDASYKYNLANHMTDILEARPHGRLLSFDPATGRTAVLARDLYFANGVAMSPDQSSLIYCETVVRRCSRYHITGDKKGTVEKFIDNLPGVPDNIRYDGEGRYWIALSAVTSQISSSHQSSLDFFFSSGQNLSRGALAVDQSFEPAGQNTSVGPTDEVSVRQEAGVPRREVRRGSARAEELGDDERDAGRGAGVHVHRPGARPHHRLAQGRKASVLRLTNEDIPQQDRPHQIFG